MFLVEFNTSDTEYLESKIVIKIVLLPRQQQRIGNSFESIIIHLNLRTDLMNFYTS